MASLTRQELYELVWAEAVSRVAERFSLSGAGLRKICLRNNIPLPPRGHWAKVAAGKRVKRPPLPEPEEAAQRVLLPERREGTESQPERSFEDIPLVAQRKRFEADPKNKIAVRDGAKLSHPWARELKQRLKEAKPNYRGFLEAQAMDHLVKVEVSANAAERALGIVDALGRALEKRRIEVVGVPNMSYGYPRYREGRFVVEDVHLRIRLVERSRRKEKPKSKSARPASIWDRDYRYTYEPTGVLRLTLIGEDSRWSSVERELRDKAKDPLEQNLNQVLVLATEIAAEIRQRRLDREEANRRYEAERARRQELQRRKDEEAARLRALEELAERRWRAVKLRELIAAAEAAGVPPGPPGAPSEIAAWLEWASEHAASLDPLTQPAGNKSDLDNLLASGGEDRDDN